MSHIETQRVRRCPSRRLLPLLLSIALLTGCKTVTLVEDITQRRANEIVATLHERGIAGSVEKQSGGGSAYRVEVRSEYYHDALSLLNQRGLLEEPPPSFEDLTASRGLLPSSREMEALRMDYAIAGQVAALIEAHPAVDSVKVIVRQNYRAEGVEPSASVLIRVKGGDAAVSETEIRQVLGQALPGIAPGNIFLSTAQAAGAEDDAAALGAMNIKGAVRYIPLVPFVLGWRVPEGDYNGLALTMLTCFVITGVVGAIAGFLFGAFSSHRRVQDLDSGESIVKSARLERPKRDLLDF